MNEGFENVISRAKELVAQNKATCVVIKDGVIVHTLSERGIKPILKMYEKGTLENAVIVDKVIGRAAAMIMTLGNIHSCFGFTMSRGAVEYLEDHGISAQYQTLTEYIINRNGDGTCPMEAAVKDINSAEDAVAAVKNKLRELESIADKNNTSP